jgi:hypothetical protein
LTIGKPHLIIRKLMVPQSALIVQVAKRSLRKLCAQEGNARRWAEGTKLCLG